MTPQAANRSYPESIAALGALPAWLARPEGPAHRESRIDAAFTACRRLRDGMRQTTVTACAVFGVALCDVCWPTLVMRTGGTLRGTR